MAREIWLLAPLNWPPVPGVMDLDPEEAHHVSVVLRARVGDPAHLVDGRGNHAIGTIISVSKKRAQVSVTAVEHHPRPATSVTIALAVLHTQAMDWAIQKCVEVGVTTFVPVLTTRSQGSLRHAQRRLEHWRRVARQALKQCQRPWSMDVEDLDPISALLERGPWLVGDPMGGTLGPNHKADGAGLLIGPEGGFTAEEIHELRRFGWQGVSLGPHVLRAETAAVVGGALLVLR